VVQYIVGGRLAWLIWATSVCVYVVAVFHRGSLGVAGLMAAERFSVTATQLASLTVAQFAVYAAMQIPVGVLLDRFGSRWMLSAGLAVMTIAQLVFAIADSFAVAVASRVLLGAGDALIFVSLLRLVAAWFRVSQTSFLAYLSAQVGQLGAVASVAPLSLALGALGWTATFALAAACGPPLLVLVVCVVRDSPQERGSDKGSQGLAELVGSLRVVWQNPGTRLAAWAHFLTQFPVVVLAMLWGFPFLVKGEGLSQQGAGSLLM
jgi:sugar phosphate permease